MSIFLRCFNSYQFTGIKAVLLIVPFAFLVGCASLSKNECDRGDWAKIGKQDGSRGYMAKSQLNKHKSACAKYQISPQSKTYYLGYRQGLQQFCRRESGLKYGVNSSKYLGVCPASLEPSFISGYLPGLEIAMNDITSDIDELRHRRHKLKRRLHLLDHHDVKVKGDRKDKGKSKNKNKKRKDSYKKLESELDDVHSSISSKRSKMNKLRSWYERWAK